MDAGSKPAIDRPERASFEAFLLADARVPSGELASKGQYAAFSFEGREILRWVVRKIDEVLGTPGGEPMNDSSICVAGGARLGKTVIEQNLGAYLCTHRWLNAGLYLPDDKLAEDIVDTKFRADVLNQIDYVAKMAVVGKATSKSGKSVNRKGAINFTDGASVANFIVAGLQSIPTSLDLDLTMEDEKDDIPEKNAAYLTGRTSHSRYRIEFIIGTQRVDGRGQQQCWAERSQGVGVYGPLHDDDMRAAHPSSTEVAEVPALWINLEEHFPAVVRCQLGDAPSADDPQLTWQGDFRHADDPETVVARFTFDRSYYLAHPDTGDVIDRAHPLVHLRAPERVAQRKHAIRVSQLGLAAISLTKILKDFQVAVEKQGEHMERFRCDVLALPKSMTQALNKEVLDRAEGVAPFVLRRHREAGRAVYAGLDMGAMCHLWLREREHGQRKRLIHAASHSGRAILTRVAELQRAGAFDALFVDAGPELDLSRSIAFTLNGLAAVEHWPAAPLGENAKNSIVLPGGLMWDGNAGRWRGLRAAMVRFSQSKPGHGIGHTCDEYPDADGRKKFVPVIEWNRDEAIGAVVAEFLTPEEGYEDVSGGTLRIDPAMLLPLRSSNPVLLDEVRAQLMRGSEREKDDGGKALGFKKKLSNHYLLADAYSAMAEMECSGANAPVAFGFDSADDEDDFAPVRGEITSGHRGALRC